MKYNNKTLKAVVLSMVLAAAMVLAAGACAQENSKCGGGLFGLGDSDDSGWFGGLLRGDSENVPGAEGDITIDPFVEAPLGSGLVILIGAGLGYVALKKKEDER